MLCLIAQACVHYPDAVEFLVKSIVDLDSLAE